MEKLSRYNSLRNCQQIADCLLDNPQSTIVEIAKLIGQNYQIVYNSMKELIKREMVVKEKKSRLVYFSLSESALEILQNGEALTLVKLSKPKSDNDPINKQKEPRYDRLQYTYNKEAKTGFEKREMIGQKTLERAKNAAIKLCKQEWLAEAWLSQSNEAFNFTSPYSFLLNGGNIQELEDLCSKYAKKEGK